MTYFDFMTKSNATQQKIMESALAVFLEKGFGNTSVPQIVKHASVAQGTFYRYFKNKKECFNQLVEKLLEALSENFERTIQDTSKDSLISGPKRGIELIRRNKELLRLMIMESKHMDQSLLENMIGMRAYIVEKSAEKLIKEGDNEQLAMIKAKLINNLMDSVVMNEVLEEFKIPNTKISTGQLLESIIYKLKV